MKYDFDVFISWCGRDKNLKNEIKKQLYSSGIQNVYDSEDECKGNFHTNFAEALTSSKVFLLILTDNLYKIPGVDEAVSYISRCYEEVNIAEDQEMRGELNVQVVNFSTTYNNSKGYRDYDEKGLGRFYYVATRGRSIVQSSDFATDDEAISSAVKKVREFIEGRDVGKPVVFKKADYGIVERKIPSFKSGVIRKDVIEKINLQFGIGKKIVVLQGEKGIGKTHCVENFMADQAMKGFKCVFSNATETDEFKDVSSKMLRVIPLSFEKRCALRNVDDCVYNQEILDLIAKLPEYYVICFVGASDLSEAFFRDLLGSGFSCRVVVCTDSVGRETAYEDVGYVEIEAMSYEDAKKVFDETAGFVSDEGDFNILFELMSGNTLALNIVAKTVKDHGIRLKDFIMKISGDPDGLDEETVIEYKGIKRRDTLMGHLVRIFNMSEMTDDESELLVNLCVIRSNYFSVDQIKQMMGYTNLNTLNRLVEKGWLEYSENRKVVFFHKLFSIICTAKLRPSLKTTAKAVKFLLEEVGIDNAITFEQGEERLDSVWYAIKTIAESSEELCHDLFKLFRYITEYLQNLSSQTAEKCRYLLSKLKKEEDKSVVEMFIDELNLCRNSNSLANFDEGVRVVIKYVGKTGDGEFDNKWLYKRLAMLQRKAILTDNDKYKQKIETVADIALNRAMEANDDYGVLYLLIISLFQHIKIKKSAVAKYIRRRKKEGNKGVLSLCALYLAFYKRGGIEEILTIFSKSLENAFSLKDIIKYYLFSPSIYRAAKELQKLPEEDELYPVYTGLSETMERLSETGVMDIEKFVDGMVRIIELFEAKSIPHAEISMMMTSVKSLFPVAMTGQLNAYVTRKANAEFRNNGISVQRFRQGTQMLSLAGSMGLTLEPSLLKKAFENCIALPANHPDRLNRELNIANYLNAKKYSKDAIEMLMKIIYRIDPEYESELAIEVVKAILVNENFVSTALASKKFLADIIMKAAYLKDKAVMLNMCIENSGGLMLGGLSYWFVKKSNITQFTVEICKEYIESPGYYAGIDELIRLVNWLVYFNETGNGELLSLMKKLRSQTDVLKTKKKLKLCINALKAVSEEKGESKEYRFIKKVLCYVDCLDDVIKKGLKFSYWNGVVKYMRWLGGTLRFGVAEGLLDDVGYGLFFDRVFGKNSRKFKELVEKYGIDRLMKADLLKVYSDYVTSGDFKLNKNGMPDYKNLSDMLYKAYDRALKENNKQ